MSARRRGWIAFLVVALVALFTLSVAAQSSGGRFGGSRGFGGGGSSSRSYGGGSSYGGSRSYGAGSSYSGRSPSYSPPYSGGGGSYNYSPSSGSGGSVVGGLCCIVFVVLGVILVVIFVSRFSRGLVDPPTASTPWVPSAMTTCEVRRISIAFDWTARDYIQNELARAAGRFDMNSPYGMWQSAVAARDLLVRSLGAARYVCFQSFPASTGDAQPKFDAVCADLNRRYTQATVSNARRTPLAQQVYARSEEGQGLVVVSLVVGATVRLPGLGAWPNAQTVHHALMSAIPAIADQLVALEVVWSPSVDADRLSSAEIDVLYPDLVRLDGLPPIGRMVCGYCRCVFAMELGKCPACGSREASPPPGGSPHVTNSGTTVPCKFCRAPMPAYEVQCQSCGGRVDR
jgi:uncharacterized membrane protein